MAYLLPLRLDKRTYVGTTVWFFFASNYAKIIPYALLGQLDMTNFATSLILLPLVPVGVKLGVLIQGKLDERVFYQISYWALLTIGVKLVYDGAHVLDLNVDYAGRDNARDMSVVASATSVIASNSSRLAPGLAGSIRLSSSRPRYCNSNLSLNPKNSGVQTAP